jgi:hypothetical protein
MSAQRSRRSVIRPSGCDAAAVGRGRTSNVAR